MDLRHIADGGLVNIITHPTVSGLGKQANIGVAAYYVEPSGAGISSPKLFATMRRFNMG
jgi:hypothetical protein